MSPADRIHQLLPWFVAGTLDAVETEAFRSHLPGCRPCREEMVVLESLKAEVEKHGEEFFRDHPTADRLVAAVRGDAGVDLSEDEAATVRRHLALCSTCATEARWVKGEAIAAGVNTETPATVTAVEAFRPTASRPWAWALVAAAAVFAVMLPWGLRDRPVDVTGLMQSFNVAGPERGSGETPAYKVAADAAVIGLTFEVDLPLSSFPASFALLDASGKPVWQRSGIDRDLLEDDLYLRMSCMRTTCRDGSYVGVVTPAAGSTEPPIETPFRLESE